MTTVYDVPPTQLIEAVAQDLKGKAEFKPPAWSEYVKTGVHREKAPENPDWWYVRVAAVMRKVYTHGPIGVSRLTAEWGGPKDRGSKPYKARKGSGSIVRVSLKQLEAAGLVVKKGKVGRIISPKGQSYLDNMANKVKQDIVKDMPELKKY